MAYNEILTQRVREALVYLENVQEKKMFRGITFMVNGKMCFSTGDQRLMCRIDPSMHDELLQTKHCEVMTMKNKEYRGYLYIHEDNLKTRQEFEYWINLALDYNKKLQSTTQKRSKLADK
jgi:TfoX/Sxy family transcriptional regulator of competence genes